MAENKEKKIDLDSIPQEEKIKYEIAGEMCIVDKEKELGWKSLSEK